MRTRSSAHVPDASKNFSATLPLELLELVYSFLQPCDAWPTKRSPLKATSLVCRQWRAPSQRLLFHTLSILLLPWSAPLFAAFILSAPHIAPAVRQVKLSTDGVRNLRVRGQYKLYNAGDSNVWAPALRLLENVAYLTVAHFEDNELELVADLIRSVWPSTAYLTLIDCGADCFHAMLAPFSSCDKLRTLDFMDEVEVEVDWPGNTSSRKCCADAVVQLSNLQKLAINVTTSDAQDFLRWLSLPNVSMPHLKQIELSFHRAEDIEYMFELLSDPLFTIWTRIDKVILDLQDSRIGGTDFNLRGLPSAFYLPLGQFAHLEMFTNRSQPHGIIDAITWWGYSLRGHTSLQTLSLSFRSVAVRTSKLLRAAVKEAWGGLDMMLSQDTHASLREVRFVDEKRRLITRDANPDLVRSIREAMPRLSTFLTDPVRQSDHLLDLTFTVKSQKKFRTTIFSTMNTHKEVLLPDDLPKTTILDLLENAASTSTIQSTKNDEPSDASKPRRRRKFVGTKSTKTFASSQLASSPPAFPSSTALTSALSILPSNYTFEVPKTIAMIRKHDIKTVGLQMPEGLQMYACVVADLLTRFAYSDTGEESDTELEVVILGDVTYGACCVDDYTARALGVELLVHYGHSCLVPLSTTGGIRTLYVFVEIAIDLKHAEDTIRANLPNGRGRFTDFIGALEGKRAGDKIGGGGYLTIRADDGGEGQRDGTEDPAMRIALVSTIQFATALSALRDALSISGYHTILPRAHPLSPGEILGCTAPSLPADDPADAILYLGDGRFHLEAMMLANPDVPAFRYDPYSKKLTREGYDHVGMRAVRRRAVGEARTTLKTGGMWGIILGTLGRQGNTGHLDALMNIPKSSPALPILLSELSPSKLALFSPHIDVFVQTSCPRLSIDWGAAFERPLLSVYEAGVACGVWEWGGEIGASKEDGAHPMDFYKRGSRWAEARQTGRLTSS